MNCCSQAKKLVSEPLSPSQSRAWQISQQQKLCRYCAASSPFSGILVPEVLTDLGALGSRSCFSRFVQMSKLCATSFSSASMHCAVNWKMHEGKT